MRRETIMSKSKLAAIASSAALVAALGLCACGGQAANDQASSDSSVSTEVTVSTDNTSNAIDTTSADDATSDTEADDEAIISWQGTLEDGSQVDYISSADEANGSLVIESADPTQSKSWLGSKTSTADGKQTITDDETKETVTFTLSDVADDGTMQIDIEGYGKGTLNPLTAADWAKIAEEEE